MAKKKILVIIPDRFEKSTGGMGANSAPLFEILGNEYDLYIAAFPLIGTKPPAFVKEYKEVSSPYTEVKHGALSTMIAQTRYLAAAVSFPKPDLVYAFDWSIYLAATEAARHFGVPLVARMCLSPILLSEQGYTFGLDMKEPLQKALHNAFCEMEIRGIKAADRVVHVSRGYAKLYEHLEPFKNKSRLVINGIDLEKWQDPHIPKFPLPGKGKYKVVFLGRLAEMKGIIPLCRARVPEDMDLIFIGNRETGDSVCIQAIQEKIVREKNVHAIGALYGKDKIAALRSADALIVPSYHEPFGGAGLEGLAAGCIVLTSRAGGLSDYLTERTSISCGTTPCTIEQSYKKFLLLLNAEKKALQEAGFAMCRELTIESAASQLRAVFEELL